jgi:hypothetical protein
MATLWDDGGTTWDAGDTSWDSNTYPCFAPCSIPGPGCEERSRGNCYTLETRRWIEEYDEYPCQEIQC